MVAPSLLDISPGLLLFSYSSLPTSSGYSQDTKIRLITIARILRIRQSHDPLHDIFDVNRDAYFIML